MNYRVVIIKRAKKEIEKLPKKHQQRVTEAIITLQTDPFVGKELHADLEGLRAIRVWPYRILYQIEQKVVTVRVLRVGHRQGVYK